MDPRCRWNGDVPGDNGKGVNKDRDETEAA